MMKKWRKTFARRNKIASREEDDTIFAMNTSRPCIITVIAIGVCLASARAAEKTASASAEIPVTMIVPGFVVRELPVSLTNITSLEYDAAGKLWALGYDGRIHILTDTNNDGLEDTAKTWWQPKDAKAFRGPIGMKVTKGGVYVASKGKISLIKDMDNDGTADTEEIIATGWKEAFTAVDATGLALDKEGNVYFGLGCADFSNAYQLDKEKKAHYDINSSQGTIQRLSADHKNRETLATGVRFAIGIAFNRFGDLFWTDQEGDTWTHGNHLDELNVLLPGKRHYGFPERHPQYLPNTDDEPPVVGFGPQHQSTCGLKFNEAREGWKTFGPKLWENDALIVGESRGKLWRVPLAKVREGYIGRETLIGVTQMLTVDLAVSPKGEMVICCHSGKPDWGTGPTGKGRLFKISYVDEKAPQPVIAWPESTDEIRLAFDRKIDPSVEQRMVGLTVSCGQYVRAADRLETMRPPYVAVTAQMQTPRRELKIESAHLIDGGQMLSVKLAEPMPWRSWYAVAVPGVKLPGAPGLGTTVDFDFQAQGVEAELKFPPDANVMHNMRIWLPHLSPEVSFEMTRGSLEHDKFKTMLAGTRQGELALSCSLDLPGKEATLNFTCDKRFSVNAAHVQNLKVETKTDAQYMGQIKVPTDGKPVPLFLNINLDEEPAGVPRFSITYTTDQTPTPRPIPLDRILRGAWPTETQPVVTTPAPSPLTKGGDWNAGKTLFFGEAKCSTCHTLRGEGGALGPNLSHLNQVNPESILQDIIEPSARINPDHITYIVTTASGDTVSGLVRQDGEQLIVMEAVDKQTKLSRADVREVRPSKISLMPEGYKELGEKKLRDLLLFLTEEAPPKPGK
jgi:putative heme-binding domain-containing protein